MRYQIIAAILVITGLLIASSMDYEDAVKQESDYCSGVKEWAATGGHGGHPDYKGIYSEVCK